MWESVDADWESWLAEDYGAACTTAPARKAFEKDAAAMRAADIGILLLPCGSSAHLEIGWMAGQNKRTLVWGQGHIRPELMWPLAGPFCISEAQVLELLAKVAASSWPGYGPRPVAA